MLKIRRFVQGRDEVDWVRVWNAEYGEHEGLRTMTVEEQVALDKSPDFEVEGRFIAKLDGQPVGIVHAYVDKLRDEKKGFIRTFGVVPEHRGKGVEETLVEVALKEFKNRGMETVQTGTLENREDMVSLWENLGFKLVRKFSLMARDLTRLPSNIGENMEVTLKSLQRSSDDDLKMINWLDNECFREHFNWRPSPVERTIFFIREDPFFKQQEWFFAMLNEKYVGYIGIGIDEKYNTEKNARCGWILDVGVLKLHRKTGIGTRLMLHGMNRLKAMGMKKVMLGVDDWNVTKAMKLYEKVGFKVAYKDLAYERTL